MNAIVWIGIAFIFGTVSKIINLPPLIGYLAAGFLLPVVGFDDKNTLGQFADLGVTLLLFTIGLKVKTFYTS